MHNLPQPHTLARILIGALIASTFAFFCAQTAAVAKPSVHPQKDARRWHAWPPNTSLRWFRWLGADADRDGLANWTEIVRTKTSWHNADTDGDGVGDGAEVRAGSDPLDPDSTPAPTPPTEPTPPETPPTDPTPPEPPIDPEPPEPPTPPTEPPPTPPTEPPTEEPPPGPPQAPCASGTESVDSATAVRSAVAAGRSVCVAAPVGDLGFSGLGERSGVVISTEGAGSLGHLEISRTSGLTLRSARLRSVTIRGSDRTTIEGSTIGGTAANRVMDQLIFMPDQSNDVVIRNNDIGWTEADDSGNTGYGCRCYGKTDRLQFVGNIVHDIAADGFQGTNGADVLIDRNKIGPVGANPGSSEHSDNIQIVGNGPRLRITNNWIYGQGYFDGKVTNNAGSTYIHGGTANSVLYENNLVQLARGRTEVCGLGTGGTSRSNIAIRRNTWIEGGLTYNGFPGFEWDCDSGAGNTVERNIAVDADGGFAQNGSSAAATFSANLWGAPSLVAIDAQGNCTSANCNPPGQEAIGYRKPSGVRW